MRLPHIVKVYLLEQLGVYPRPQSLCKHGPQFSFDSISEEQAGKEESQSDCSVASHHCVLKLESDNRDVAGRIRISQKVQCRSISLSMSTVLCTIGDANACSFQSRVNEVMEALWTFHSAANGIE
ncbi:hypothetical protein TNCV_1869041 [Trichonephila clavipes]|nr:hypothetical protein TNCV_1869041 [Trichonephila clavipes]